MRGAATPGAPRLPSRPWRRPARGVLLLLALVAGFGGAVFAEDPKAGSAAIVDAAYAEPTARYPHGALGDPMEWGALVLTLSPCPGCQRREVRLRLPEDRVFEDTAPRLADIDGDGVAEVVVVESHALRGARLAVWDETGPVMATAFIGQRNRWLAPVGIADLDGDGRLEIAYVDRPHLARILRVVRPDGSGGLVEIASAPGHTNHRFGAPEIAGGIADCGLGPEMLTADPDWRRVQGTRLVEGRLVTRDLGAFDGTLACPG